MNNIKFNRQQPNDGRVNAYNKVSLVSNHAITDARTGSSIAGQGK